MSIKQAGFVLTIFFLTAFALAQPPAALSKQDLQVPGKQNAELTVTAAKEAADSSGKVYVLVQLSGDSTITAFNKAMGARGASQTSATGAARAQAQVVLNEQREFLSRLASQKFPMRVLYTAQRVYNGVALYVDADQVEKLAAMPGVKRVSLITLKTPDLFTSVPLQNVPGVWSFPFTSIGTGISIGIIDTGTDYVHVNFGGDKNYTNDTTIIGDNPNFPSAKVVGGTDFVGDAYNASDPLNNIPHPDPDPMDCNGHGSHVSGIAAGLGVTTAGATYPGPYDNTTHSSPLRIGPGVAPGALIYALRVFGCTGSTAVTDQAIEWAVDPNGDFDTSDHLNVINMSLGSNFGSPDDSSAVASEAAASVGVIVAAAAGNAGDVYYINSSPGTSIQTITVANSVDSSSVLNGLIVNAPPVIAGNKAATYAVYGPTLATTGDITQDVVLVTDGVGATNDGCTALTNAGAVAGRIALVDRGTCTFKTKTLMAQNAGAVGVIVANNAPGFPITMGDDATIVTPITIPSEMITQADGNAIKTQLAIPVVVNATLTNSLANSIMSIDPSLIDTLSSTSSRGPRRGNTGLKPDITAVGDTVFSTLALSGDQGLNISGTSMATPHIAGAAAVLRQLNPTVSVEDIKAMLMNSSTHDLFTGLNQTGSKYGDGRVGSGRLDLLNAATNRVVVFDSGTPGQVSLSFGVAEVVESGGAIDYTDTRTATVKNLGVNDVTYNLSIVPSNTGTNLPGVAYSLPGGSPVTVPAGGSISVPVQLDADASSMAHLRDSSVSGSGGRHWLSEETGYLVLTPTSGSTVTIRVPLYVAARPASNMGTAEVQLSFTAPSGSLLLDPVGIPTNTVDEFSMVSTFLLQIDDPDEPTSTGLADNADIRYVGLTTSGTNLNVGLSTVGNWNTPAEVSFRIWIDADRNGTYENFIANLSGGGDIFLSGFCPPSGTGCTGTAFLNVLTGSQPNSVVYNTNMMFFSVPLASLGIAGPFNYFVESFSRDAAGTVDTTAVHTYDPTHPGLTFPGNVFSPNTAPLNADLPGLPFTVNYNVADFQANQGLGLLLLHHHNTADNHAQVLPAPISDLTVTKTDNPDPVFLNNHVTYFVTVTNNGPDPATGVDLIDTLDPNSTFQFSSQPGVCFSGPGFVECTPPTLAVGETFSVYITVSADAAGTLTNTAQVVSRSFDPNFADNTAITTTTVNDTGTNAELTLTKTDVVDPVFNGTEIEYNINVSSGGPDPATSVVVTDYLPLTTTLISATPSQGTCSAAANVVTCALGTMPGFSAASINIKVQPHVAGVVNNVATATADTTISPASTPTDVEDTTVLPNAEVAITKTEDADPHAVGDTITYTVDVINNGPDVATNVEISDQLPVLAPYQSLVAPADWLCSEPTVGTAGGTVTCGKPTMAPGEAAQFVILVTAALPGGYTNTGVIFAGPGDSNLANNVAFTHTSVFSPPAATPTACAGTETTYFNETPVFIAPYSMVSSTITVANADPYIWDVDLVTFLEDFQPYSLGITITSPSGREVTISSNNGSCCDSQFSQTAWDDQANNPVTDFPFFSAPATPLTVEEALGAFRGEDPNGDWTIWITDYYGSAGVLNAWSLRLTTLAAVPNETTRSFVNNNSAQLPPIGTFTSAIDVANAGKVCNLDLVTNISHIESDQLILTLTSPAGMIVTLSSFNGNLNTFMGTLWDDNAGDTNPPGPITDNVIDFGFVETPVVPESAMAAFNGQDADGTWTLTVTDVALDPLEIFFPAMLNNWSLDVGTCSCGTSDIMLTKTDDPDPVQGNDSLHYTLTVTNNGPDDATGVQVLDPLPNGALFVSASAECTAASSTVTCNVGDLANGAQKVLDIYVQPTLDGVLSNTACAFAFEADPGSGNNCDTETTQVQLNPPIHTDLSINKTDSADPTNAGSTFTYALTVLNNGPDDSDGFTVTDTLPAEVTFVSASPGCTFLAGTVTCVYPGPLADGASVSFLVNVTANTAATASNTACVAANDIDTDPANDCDTETTQIDPGPTSNSDLALDKVDNPDPVQVGDSLHYTLTVTNNGPDPAVNLVVTDALHPSLTFVTASAGCVNNSGVVTCTAAGPIASAATVVFDVYVVPTLAGPIPNTACVSGFVNDPDSANNCDTETTTVTLNAPGFTDLAMAKSDTQDPVISTSTFSYLLTVTNQGPDESQGFTVTDTLPNLVSFVSATPGCTHDGSPTGGVVTCVFNGNLVNGGTVSLMITVTAGNVVAQTVATNMACVAAENSDTVSANNCDSEDTTIDPVPPISNADLSLTKDDSFDPLQVGSLLTYILTVTNNGPDTATQIHVTDTLHPSTVFLSASPGCVYDGTLHTVTCDIASLAIAGVVQLQIQVGTTLAGTIVNTACVAADFNNDGTGANNCDSEATTITIVPPILTDLSLTKTASASSVLAGNNITYTLGVFNDGPDISTGHTVTDTLPVEVTFVSASTGCVHDGSPVGGVVTCQFGPLGNNSSTSYTIVVRAITAPQAVNNACVFADNFDLTVGNNCASATTIITPTSVDLSLVKTGSPQTTTVNQTVDYTITVTNNGPDASTGSTVVDTLPGEVQFVSASPGCTHASGVVTCAIGALTLGNSTSIVIQVQVVATGTFINTATVTGNDLDPNSANDTDTETTIASQCLFCDDFEDSVIQPAGVWTYTPDITGWSEDGDNLVGQATGKTKAIASPIFSGCLNCTVETQISTAGGPKNKIWFLAWYVDDNNTIELLMRQDLGKWILRQRSAGVIVRKANAKIPINVGQFYTVKITFNGSAFTVGIDANATAITMNPGAPVPTGTVGYRVKATTARIAYINVN